MAKFNVGDRVRLNEVGYNRMSQMWREKVSDWYVGLEGIVDFGSALYCTIEFIGVRNPRYNDGEAWLVRVSDIEIVESAAPASPKRELRVGDRVRVRVRYGFNAMERTGVIFVNEERDYRLAVRYDDSGGWDFVESVEVIETLDHSAPIAPPAPAPKRSTRTKRPYAAPRNTTIAEAKNGDDRPATNSAEFEEAMLAAFDESDVETLEALTTRWAAKGNDAAIDAHDFAQRIKRRVSEDAA